MAPSPLASRYSRVLWFWAKVVLILALVDVLLFRTGWFWTIERHPAAFPATAQFHDLIGRIATHPADTPVAVAVGSSIVRMSGGSDDLSRRLARGGIGSQFINLGVDGLTAKHAAMMAHAARGTQPWLVLYGFGFRDFFPGLKRRRVLERLFLESSFDLASMQPDSIDEWLARFARSHWRLYRYRRLVGDIITQELNAAVGSIPAPAHAQSRPRREAPPLADRFPRGFRDGPSFPAWKKWYRTRAFSDYEAYLRTGRHDLLELYRKRRHTKGALESSQLAAVDWLLRFYQERGTRVVLIYYPENPVFREPAGDAYFDAALSDEVAALMKREAARYGARFVDLRNALGPADFMDMVHPNAAGVRRMDRILLRLIAHEWLLANENAAVTGSGPP